jgi:hypothetical protein
LKDKERRLADAEMLTHAIGSAEITLVDEYETPQQPVGTWDDVGFSGNVELRTDKSKPGYRFAATNMDSDQVTSTRHRTRLSFVAGSHSGLTGRPIRTLNDVRFLALEPDLLRPTPGARNETTHVIVTVNGTPIALQTVNVPADANTKEWGTVNIADEMRHFDTRVADAIKRTAAPTPQ